MTTKEEYEECMYVDYKDKDGKDQKDFVTENGISYLLEYHENSIFFIPGRLENDPDDEFVNRPCIFMALNCNDLFYWACADMEILRWEDIEPLYLAIKADERWGDAKWACKKRGTRPQHPIEDDMKKDGAWDAEMEVLPVRGETG